jgi:hypothetical protein
MQKRLVQPEDPSCSMVDYPTPGLILQNPSKKGTFLIPHRLCEMVHKINCLHKPPRPMEFSLQHKEEENEKFLTIRNHFDGADSLLSVPGPNT